MTNISLSKIRKLPYDTRLKMAVAQNSLAEIHLLMKEYSERDHDQAIQCIADYFGTDGLLKTIHQPIKNIENICHILAKRVEYVNYDTYYILEPTIFISCTANTDIAAKIILNRNIDLYYIDHPKNMKNLISENVRHFLYSYPSIIDDKRIIDISMGDHYSLSGKKTNMFSSKEFIKFIALSKNEEIKQYIKDCASIYDIIV